MDAVVAALVAVFAERDAQVVQSLLDVMRVTGCGGSADSTWQGLDLGQVLAIFNSEILAVHG